MVGSVSICRPSMSMGSRPCLRASSDGNMSGSKSPIIAEPRSFTNSGFVRSSAPEKSAERKIGSSPLSLSPSLLSLLLTCQDDRRGVGRLWGELLGGGRVVAGRGRGGRLIRNLGARAEVARVPAPQFTADVHRVVLQVRISIYRTIFRSPPLLSFARALRKMQRERERKRGELTCA